jgi:hypothetical protein
MVGGNMKILTDYGPMYGHDSKIALADIVTAFDVMAIGTKVMNDIPFMRFVSDAIKAFDWSTCRQSGQAYIPISKEACALVFGGVGKRTQDPKDYVIRTHRGQVGMYLRRNKTIIRPSLDHLHMNEAQTVSLAAPVDNVAVVAYTLDAYLKDPDCTPEECERVKALGCTHVLVAVLASCGKPSTLTPHRFVANLAGGNLEALTWTADEIRQKAKEIKEFTSEWSVVAD